MLSLPLDARCTAIIQTLMLHNDYVTILELAKTLNVSRRSIYYDLHKVNDWCEQYGIATIQVERSKGIYLTKDQKDKIKILLKNLEADYIIFQPRERIAIIICTLLAQTKPSFIEYFSTICDVSRNTIFSDLKSVRKKLENYGLELKFETHIGYTVEGSIIKQRAVFLYYLEVLMPLIKQGVFKQANAVNFFDAQLVDKLYSRLKKVEDKLKIIYVDGVIYSLSILLNTIFYSQKEIDFEDIDIFEIKNSPEFALVAAAFADLVISEQIYLAMHFLGSRIQVPSISTVNDRALELATALVDDFEKLACINFELKSDLIKMLAQHLHLSIYRYKYGIQLGNPLIEDIKKRYTDLYDITEKSVRILREQLSYPIPPSEIAYITMHFAGYLNKRTSLYSRILIVCPNGISTANMLKSEVECLHPSIEVVDIVSADEIASYQGHIDFIISTIDINAFVPVIRVNPIISEEDRVRILSRVVSGNLQNRNSKVQLDKIIKVISNYINEDKIEKVTVELTKLLSPHFVVKQHEHSIRLFDVLYNSNILFKKKVKNWQDAIKLASKPLLDNDSISTNYVNAMIKNVQQYGPYIVIAPYMALAHALPSDGVSSLGISILKLQEDVYFESDPVSMIFVLAPIDKKSHLGIIKDIMWLLNQKEFVYQLAMCESSESIALLIDNYRKIYEETSDEYEDNDI